MQIHLTKHEIHRLLQAMEIAKVSELDLINCYRTGWSKRRGPDGHYRRVVPASDRPVVARSKAAIAAWAKLRGRLLGAKRETKKP